MTMTIVDWPQLGDDEVSQLACDRHIQVQIVSRRMRNRFQPVPSHISVCLFYAVLKMNS